MFSFMADLMFSALCLARFTLRGWFLNFLDADPIGRKAGAPGGRTPSTVRSPAPRSSRKRESSVLDSFQNPRAAGAAQAAGVLRAAVGGLDCAPKVRPGLQLLPPSPDVCFK